MSKQQKLLVDVIKKQLNSIGSPFTIKLSSQHFGLTPTEIRVAGLIAKGLTSKEIADVTHVSKECIDFHRYNIRKKIGIVGKKVNLQTYLSSIFSVP